MTPSSPVSHTVDISWPSVGAVCGAATIRATHVREAAYWIDGVQRVARTQCNSNDRENVLETTNGFKEHSLSL